MNKIGKVSIHRDASDKTAVTIVDEDNIPVCIYLTDFINSKVSEAINTKKTYAYQLLYIYRYFESKNIDIPKRIQSGKYFTPAEYKDFNRHCNYKDIDWGEKANVSSFKKFIDKDIDKMMHASNSSNELVGSATVKIRLSLFLDYIEYLHDLHHFTSRPDSEVQYRLTTLSRLIKDDRRRLKDQNERVCDVFDSEISDSNYCALKECIEPDSPKNPFTSATKHRNYLILKIIMEGGLRISAIAKLKTSNIQDDWENPRIRVTKTPDDKSDHRIERPSTKTNSHITPISKDTMNKLLSYVEDDRSAYSKSLNHEFVFVVSKGEKGEPLTLSGFSYIFEELSNHLGFHLTAHMIRHKWNEEFSAAARRLGYSPENIEDIRKRSMGWSESSKMETVSSP